MKILKLNLFLDFCRIAERQTFKSTGKATLRIRYSGQLTNAERSNTTKLQKLQICLSTSNGNDLKNMIAGELQVAANRLKLISAGKVIEENKMLEAQNLKNGGQIMALFLSTDKETFQVSSSCEAIFKFFDVCHVVFKEK